MADLDSASEITVSRSKVGSSLAAALAAYTPNPSAPPLSDALYEYWHQRSLIVAAARERLRLSRIPCETCGGTGNCGRLVDDFGYDDPVICGSCGGSGEVWSNELVEVVSKIIDHWFPLLAPSSTEVVMSNFMDPLARAVLDALDLHMKEAK